VFKLPKYGEGVCLARLSELLTLLGIDRDALQRRSLVITGSNGKGSTAALCAGIGRALGLCCGLFTSPHLYRFSERFQIDGRPIDDATLARLVAEVEAGISEVGRRRGEQFGAFEAQFALACLYFQNAGCGLAVFEAGIGGRFDPVRLVGAQLTAVTSVDLEHVALLGHSLQLIAADKSDACAAGGTVIYGENCRGLRDHLAAYNRAREVAGLFVRDEIEIGGEVLTTLPQRFDLRIDGADYAALELRLPGAFQVNNAAIAVALLRLWLRRNHPELLARSEPAIREGLRETFWPGRLETIRAQPLTVVDAGHTPDAIRRALAALHAIHGTADWILVLGVSQDKKASEIVAELAPSFDRIVATSAHHKGAAAADIAAAARAANPTAAIELAPDIADALRLSTDLATQSGRRIYVAGGLFLAIEYAYAARGGRAEELDFF
jgi:dihydrofolate synthase/folylpolyglutamate synthase